MHKRDRKTIICQNAPPTGLSVWTQPGHALNRRMDILVTFVSYHHTKYFSNWILTESAIVMASSFVSEHQNREADKLICSPLKTFVVAV
mmetsp:Transcript_21121/g.50196  ORF Transcript_21121/g.50196 Transcript_21121/m.50196 type:complete len:89 (+) Transcript_21121:340-606(+)